MSRKPLIKVLAAVVLVMATAVATGASPEDQHTMYVTFNRPVSLPGVTLRRGTYIFETPEADFDNGLVRVLSRDRSIVILTTFTHRIDRPFGMRPEQPISFGEPSSEGTLPITVWWARDSGHQFIYPNR
jgi:hypothetical protein